MTESWMTVPPLATIVMYQIDESNCACLLQLNGWFCFVILCRGVSRENLDISYYCGDMPPYVMTCSGIRRIFSRGGGDLTLHVCHDRCRARPEKVNELGVGGGGGDSDTFFPFLKNFLSIFQTSKSRGTHHTSPTSLTSKKERKKVFRSKGGGGGGYPSNTPTIFFSDPKEGGLVMPPMLWLAVAYAGFFQGGGGNIACMLWSMPRQAWKSRWAKGGGGGGGTPPYFFSKIFCQFSRLVEIRVPIVHHQPLWQAKKKKGEKWCSDPNGGGLGFTPPIPSQKKVFRIQTIFGFLWLMKGSDSNT